MRPRLQGVVKPIPVLLGIVVVVAIGGGLLAKVGYDAAMKKVEERQAERKSAQGLVDAAQRIAQGKRVEGGQEFPDTTQGRMSRLVYGLILSEQERDKALADGLHALGWDWVMTPESLRTKESVEECIRRTEKAEALVKGYGDGIDEAWQDLIKKMEAEAQKSKEGREYFEGFKSASGKPGGGLYFVRKISGKLMENHEALKTALQFLLDRSGRYKVDDQGMVTFDRTVSLNDRAEYDSLIDKVNSSLEEVGRLDKLRQQTAQDRVKEAQQYLKGGK